MYDIMNEEKNFFSEKVKTIRLWKQSWNRSHFFRWRTVKVSAATEGVVAMVPDHFSPNGIQDTKKNKNIYIRYILIFTFE